MAGDGIGLKTDPSTNSLTINNLLGKVEGYWGSFWDTTDQGIASTTLAYVMTLNNTDPDSNGVYIENGSKITFKNKAVYNIQFSVQFSNANSNASLANEATIWIKKNGNDVPQTAGIVTIPTKHGSTNGAAIAAWNYILSLNADDYVEFYWHASNTSISIDSSLDGGNPTHPDIPGLIVTAQQVLNIARADLIDGGNF